MSTSCCLLLGHRCDRNHTCNFIWPIQCIYFCCSYRILRKCLFKIPMLHLIMLFQIRNLHHSYSLLAYSAHGSCAGWRENECKFFSPFFFKLLLFTVCFSLSSELGTRHFHAILAPTAGKMRTAQKTKVKVSDPAVCVSLAWRQVPVYTCWPNQNT